MRCCHCFRLWLRVLAIEIEGLALCCMSRERSNRLRLGLELEFTEAFADVGRCERGEMRANLVIL